MWGKERRSSESLCEKSMSLVANLIKLSTSLSFTKMAAHEAAAAGRPSDQNPAAVSKIPGSRRLQEPQSRAKPIYVTKRSGGSFHIRGSPKYSSSSSSSSSSYGIDEDIDFDDANVDGWASQYIERFHKKNQMDSDETIKKPHSSHLTSRHRKAPTVLN